MYTLCVKGFIFFLVALCFVLLFIPFVSYGQDSETLANAGFIPGNIWFSIENVFEGDVVKIFTVLFNNNPDNIEGTISFLSNGAEIGTAMFSIPGSDVQNLSTEWNALFGQHTIRAIIKNAKRINADASNESILLGSTETGSRELFVDRDTDKDSIGDSVDTDDDNDGLSDADEIMQKTNPLSPDTDGDGIRDSEDKYPLSKSNTRGETSESTKISLGGLEGKLPDSVSKILSVTLSNLDEMRENQEQNTKERIKLIKEEIKSEEVSSSNEGNKEEQNFMDSKLVKYGKLIFNQILLFVFMYKPLFYILGALLLYVVFRFALRIIF